MAVELDVGHAILLVPGDGEVVGDSEDAHRIELLCDRDELHATWTRYGPHRDGASPHVHRGHSDLFYVLEGELTFLVGPDREERVLAAGTLALAPPLVVHGFRNGGDAELRYLNFHAPGGGFADYLRGVAPGFDSEDPPADGGKPVSDATIIRGAAGGSGTLLVDTAELSIAELRARPGDPPAPARVDRRLAYFYVLAGELTVTAGGRELLAEPGAWLQVPPSVSCSFAPSGSDEVRFLSVQAGPDQRRGSGTRRDVRSM